MWIILLDTSSSMGDPFSKEYDRNDLTGRIRTAEDETKWQSAKKAILDEVKSLNTEERICVISFTSEAEVVFEGQAFQTGDLRARLENLTPHNGTDIAQALTLTRGYIDYSAENNINIEVITDGLSELDSAREAALLVAERAGIIDVVLIDPTPAGQKVVKSIAIRGRVTNVVSAGELGQEVGNAAKRHSIEQMRINDALAMISQEQETVTAAVPTPERLGFTAAYPGSVPVALWNPLIVYLHLQSLEEEVKKRIRHRSREVGQTLDSSTTHLWTQRGTWITLRPSIKGVKFNPPVQEVAWYEDIQEIPFRFYCNENPLQKLILGAIEIYIENVLVGQIPVSLNAGAPNNIDSLGVEENEWSVDSGRIFEKVFASYSHQDSEIVRICAAVYRSLGISMHIDRLSLLAGQEWHPALLKLIEKADVFQLYWSESARLSEYVKNEYEHALKLRNHKGNNFVRPFFWKRPLPEVPEGLSSTHFAYLEIEKLRLTDASTVETTVVKNDLRKSSALLTAPPAGEFFPEQEREYAKNIQVSVIPLLSGELRETIAKVNRDVSYAVAFLENFMGLRYYPVPTLLVDDYIVRQTRSILNVPDKVPDPKNKPEIINEIEAWKEILQKLSVEFHVSRVPPLKKNDRKILPDEEAQMYHDLNISENAFVDIVQIAEWEIRRWIEEYLYGIENNNSNNTLNRKIDSGKKYLWEKTRDRLAGYGLEDMELSLGFSPFLTAYFRIMEKIFDYGARISPDFRWEGYYEIDVSAWNFAQSKIEKLNFENRISRNKILLQGSFEDFIKLYKEISERLMKIISKIPSAEENAQLKLSGHEVFETSTYGIFAPEYAVNVDNQLSEWAVKNHIPAQSVLPKTNRVLFCTNSFSSRIDDGVSGRVIEMLNRCVLVHEHFHAIVETGFNQAGRTSATKDNRKDWEEAASLNESLAVWLEIHYVRRHKDLFDSEQEFSQTLDKLWAYVKSGQFPEWVYRGAERIETIFENEGLEAIRKLINQLHAEPKQAQKYFQRV